MKYLLLQVLEGNITIVLVFEDFIHVYNVLLSYLTLTFCYSPPTPAYNYNLVLSSFISFCSVSVSLVHIATTDMFMIVIAMFYPEDVISQNSFSIPGS